MKHLKSDIVGDRDLVKGFAGGAVDVEGGGIASPNVSGMLSVGSGLMFTSMPLSSNLGRVCSCECASISPAVCCVAVRIILSLG
jgi:hypothetical protein